MPSQSELIGDHPVEPDQFGRWLSCIDFPITTTKCHRALSGQIQTNDIDLLEWLAVHLLKHHYTDYRLNKLKEKYGQLGFPEYAEQHRKLPRTDKIKKGNIAEILLVEYVSSSLKKDLVKVFKLRYNPNIDQSIKGDDTLLIDLINEKGEDKIKVYLGESKFRGTPTSAVIKEIVKSLDKDKKPISYSYLIDELARNPDTEELANRLEKFIIDEIKSNGDLVYTGFLLSNKKTFDIVERNLNSNNDSLLFISVGIDNPSELISAYEIAEELITSGHLWI